MNYLIWILTGIAVVLGFCLGVVLGIRRDLSRESVGTIIVGYTGEEDDGAHLFLNQVEAPDILEPNDYVILRVQKVKSRK